MRQKEIDQEAQNLLYNIKWLRSQHGLSKQKMAKMLGISIGSLNQIEQGILPPKVTTDILFCIQKFFGIPPKQLFDKIEK